MKKIIVFFIVLFISIFEARASSKFILGEKLPMYIKAYNSNEMYTSSPYLLTRDDLELVYCINPFQIMSTSKYYTEYDYNASKFNLTDEQLDRMNVIAYYGYKYDKHMDIKWYGITQFVIWKQLNLTDIYFTDSNYNKINKYDSEIKELEQLMDNYYKLPSFANNTLQYSSNQTYKIIDTNNVLENYELLSSNIDIDIKDNEITINTKTDGIYNVEFIKRSPIDRQYKLYSLNGAQSLLYSGKINDIKFSLKIEVNSGDITINKLDSEGKDRVEATLEGAIYGIYSDDELITTIETNKEGIAYINDLPLGNYYVKEISPSVGYILDENIYNVVLTKENKNITITSREKIIKGNLIINKYYGDKDNYILEDKAEFEIYDKNKNLVDVLKTNNGIININLPYGNYFVVQSNGVDGYNYVDNFNVFISENKTYEYNLYDDKILVVEVPDTGVYEKNHNIISLIFILSGSILLILGKFISKKTTLS